jgi:hypothetical protein
MPYARRTLPGVVIVRDRGYKAWPVVKVGIIATQNRATATRSCTRRACGRRIRPLRCGHAGQSDPGRLMEPAPRTRQPGLARGAEPRRDTGTRGDRRGVRASAAAVRLGRVFAEGVGRSRPRAFAEQARRGRGGIPAAGSPPVLPGGSFCCAVEDARGRPCADSAPRIFHGPVPDVAGVLEKHGILVIRLPLDTADVDAFSLPFHDRPVIVLGTDKNDRARSRFDGAHELGHLVVHGDQIWGVKEVERQAHTFAAAFLMPAEDIRDELPDRADWPILFQLTRKLGPAGRAAANPRP